MTDNLNTHRDLYVSCIILTKILQASKCITYIDTCACSHTSCLLISLLFLINTDWVVSVVAGGLYRSFVAVQWSFLHFRKADGWTAPKQGTDASWWEKKYSQLRSGRLCLVLSLVVERERERVDGWEEEEWKRTIGKKRDNKSRNL